MARAILVAGFHDYGAAHRAFAELLHNGVDSGNISLIAGDNSDHYGAQRDFGILDDDGHWRGLVRSGTTLLAVRTDHQQSVVRRIIGRYKPTQIEETAAILADQ